MNPVGVYVLAGCEALRVGLVASLREIQGIEIVGESASLKEMAGAGHFQLADVLLVDVDVLDGSNSMDEARRLLPGLRVLFIGTSHDEKNLRAEDVPSYMALESVGFILKSSSIERIVHATKLVASGAFVCESTLIKRMLTRLMTWAAYGPYEQNHLSGRETEVLRLVASGKSNREISQELFLSEGTVRAHASHLLTKLGLERRTELVRYALANGLMSVADE